MERFDQTHKYKLIYVFSMPYETHKGLLKVGEATLTTDVKPSELVPNCRLLNLAAKARIDSYTKTASMSYKLEYTELAIKTDSGYTFSFPDKEVHKVLMNSGISKKQPNGQTDFTPVMPRQQRHKKSGSLRRANRRMLRISKILTLAAPRGA